MRLGWYTPQIGFATSLATPPPALASERLMTKWEATGNFWHPETPEVVYWGTIVFLPGVGSKIKLDGNILGRSRRTYPSELPVIFGRLFNGAPISCFACWCVVDTFITDRENFRSQVTAQLSVIGGHWMNSSECRPDCLQLKLSHLNEWFEAPYDICYEPENVDKCLLTFRADQLVADFEFKGEKIRLESFCSHSIPSQIKPEGGNWQYSHHLVIRPESRQGLDWMLEVASSIRDIFVFLIGSGVYTLDVVGLSDRSENCHAQVFHVNLPVTVPRSIRYDADYFLTHHRDYRKEIPNLVKEWFERLDDLNVVIETYRELLCSDGTSHTTIIFRTVQTLEHLYGLLWQDDSSYVKKATFRRFVGWLREHFPTELEHVPPDEMCKLAANKEIIMSRIGGLNNISLRSKLEKLFKKIPAGILMPILGNPRDLNEYVSCFLKRLEATRHYLTHFNVEQKTLAFSVDEIQDAALVCWAVLTYWMSRKLGLDCARAGGIALKAKDAMFLVHPRSHL